MGTWFRAPFFYLRRLTFSVVNCIECDKSLEYVFVLSRIFWILHPPILLPAWWEVWSHILSSWSDVFEKMLSHNLKEKAEQEVVARLILATTEQNKWSYESYMM